MQNDNNTSSTEEDEDGRDNCGLHARFNPRLAEEARRTGVMMISRPHQGDGPEPAAPEATGEQCECATWAKAEAFTFLTTHHPRCPRYDLEGEAVVLIRSLLVGIERWAQDEDGIHHDCWEAYKHAKQTIGEKVRLEHVE